MEIEQVQLQFSALQTFRLAEARKNIIKGRVIKKIHLNNSFNSKERKTIPLVLIVWRSVLFGKMTVSVVLMNPVTGKTATLSYRVKNSTMFTVVERRQESSFSTYFLLSNILLHLYKTVCILKVHPPP